jgi:hypothetical protein
MYGKKEGIKIVIKLPPKDNGGNEEKEVKTSKTRAEVYKSGGCCTKKKRVEKY